MEDEEGVNRACVLTGIDLDPVADFLRQEAFIASWQRRERTAHTFYLPE